MSDPFNESILFNYRETYVAKTDTLIIHNGMIILTEIPSETDGVVISGYNEIQTNNITLATQFYVDYYLGYVYFHSSKNGTQISASYMGRGIVLYPSSRIYLENPLWNATNIEGIVAELQTSITNGDNALSEQVDQITGSVLPAYYKTNILNYASGATIYDGITSAVTAINSALTHVPTGGTLYFPMLGNGEYLIDSDLTLAAYPNITLEFESGAKLSIADSKTLTGANTKINATLSQIFDLNSSGVLAGTWNIDESFPEWFGAVGDGVTNDLTSITNAFTLANKIIVSSKTYYCNNNLTIPIGITLIGLNKTSSKIKFDNSHGIIFTADAWRSMIRIEKIWIDGDGTGIGVYVNGSHYNIINDIIVNNFNTLIYNKSSQLNKYKNIYGSNGVVYGFNSDTASYFNTLNDSSFVTCDIGVLIGNDSIFMLHRIDLEGNTTTNIKIIGSCSLHDFHIENGINGIVLQGNYSDVKIEKVTINGCTNGICEGTSITGQYQIKDIIFIACTNHFTIPNVTDCEIDHVLYYTSLGGSATPVNSLGSATLTYNKNMLSGAYSVSGKSVFYKTQTTYNAGDIDFGTIAANSCTIFTVTLSGYTISYWGEKVTFYAVGYNEPAGIIITASVKSSTTNQVVINVNNITGSPIAVGVVQYCRLIFNNI